MRGRGRGRSGERGGEGEGYYLYLSNFCFSFKYLILTRMESCSYLRWQSNITYILIIDPLKSELSPVTTPALSNNNYDKLICRLLPVKENFLTRQIFTNSSVLTKDDIGRVFCLYDRVSD